MNGVIYCRVSSKEQIGGTSLESQGLACQDYARSKNINILKTFVERGESAKFADRTQLVELIDFCKQSKDKVEVLLVWKVDRFARNVGDHFNIKATLLKYGVRVVSVTEPIDSNPEGKLLETILAGFAQFDNDIRATRTVQGMRRKLQEGIFPWKPPLGYQSAIQKGDKKNEPDRPDQPLFELLQKAWKDFATGAYTKAEMLRLMESWGVHTKAGATLSDQSIDNLFRNRFYAGILVDPWTGEEHEGRHAPMVSREEFARVQQILSRGNRRVPHQKERAEFPLRGHVRCPTCQQFMTGSFARGRNARYPYYHCNQLRCGDRKSYATKLVHDEYEDFLHDIAPVPRVIERFGVMVVRSAGQRLILSKAKQEQRKQRLDRLDRQTGELIVMRAERLITDKEFLAQKEQLSERRFVLESTPSPDSVNVSDIQAHLSEITEPLTCLPEAWQKLPSPIQRRFHRFVLPVGFVHGKSGTAQMGLLFRTFGQLVNANSNEVAPGWKTWNQIVQEIIEFAGLFREYHELKDGSDWAVPRNSHK